MDHPVSRDERDSRTLDALLEAIATGRRAASILNELSGDGRSGGVGEVTVLRAIDSGLYSPSAIASHYHQSRPAVSHVIKRLTARGMVRSESSVWDRRAHVLLLTPAGRQHLHAYYQALRDARAHEEIIIDDSVIQRQAAAAQALSEAVAGGRA